MIVEHIAHSTLTEEAQASLWEDWWDCNMVDKRTILRKKGGKAK